MDVQRKTAEDHGAKESAVASVLAPPVGKSHQFVTMDGLRGVAALAVIAFHGRVAVAPVRFASGYLAVDFFFMLSGFVLTFAYGRKLDEGWSTWAYFKTRIVRLYPLYLLGLLLGFGFLMALNGYRHVALMSGGLPGSLALGLAILPVMSLHPFSRTTAFPLNYPSWSIFFELLVNIAQALFLRRKSAKVLTWVAAVSFLIMAGYARAFGTINLGVDSPENILCVARVMFSYAIGMLLFRVWRSGRFRLKVPPALIAVVLLGALALPLRHYLVLQEMLVVTLLFPVLILLAAAVEPGPRWRPVFQMLGQVSYAIYILHGPLLSILQETWMHVRHRSVEMDAPWDGLVFIVVLLGVALLVDRVYDVPARRFLRNRLLARRT